MMKYVIVENITWQKGKELPESDSKNYGVYIPPLSDKEAESLGLPHLAFVKAPEDISGTRLREYVAKWLEAHYEHLVNSFIIPETK